ncbi:MAG: aminopeptidase [Chloroflexi bacterium]|nr:aminopeptidase [Chloroflexota bacterium]
MENFDRNLEKYADVIVKVGLNLQPGQRLLVSSTALFDGASLEAAALIRLVTKSAYKLGARYVDIIWGDDEIMLSRYKYARRDSFGEYPAWKPAAHRDIVKNGDALLGIVGSDPALLKGQDADLIALQQKTVGALYKEGRDHRERHPHNWCIVALPIQAWAAKVFPNAGEAEQVDKLWDVVFQICRVYEDDPVGAWQIHIKDLKSRATYMNDKAFKAIKFTGPGTNLTLGLAEGHIWRGAQSDTERGFPYTANMPTEEIFTMPHRGVADGVVTATKPLSRGGTLMDDFSVTFENGRVVKVQAKKNEDVLRKMTETDEGAARLGEVALVPNSSPISQSGLMFYNTLFDENAASHIALGSAYRETIKNGEGMSDEEFESAGGNDSLIHTDFMIGSGEMDVDGIHEDGGIEAVMRGGEWAFKV